MDKSSALRDRFEYLKLKNANGLLLQFKLIDELMWLAKFFNEKPYR